MKTHHQNRYPECWGSYAMLNDASGFQHIYLCTGYTDLRKGIDGLISIVTGTFSLDLTEAGSIFLFCGRRNNRMKALLYEGGGWFPCYKRFTDGKLQWPRSEKEARGLLILFYICTLTVS